MLKQIWVSIIISILILMSLFNVILLGGMASGDDLILSNGLRGSKRQTIIDSDPKINSLETWENEEIYLNSNLTIEDGGLLEIKNTSITVNSSSSLDFVYGIYVEDGGTLLINSNSSITKNIFQSDNDYELKFFSGSHVLIEDSTITLAGLNSELGIYIESDDVTIINSFLEKNFNGIYCYGASPKIIGCEINYSKNHGVVCNNSLATILENCTVKESWSWDIVVENNSQLTLISTPVSFGGSKITDTSKILTYWWLTIVVTNETDVPLENASVEVKNSHGSLIFEGVTDANGRIENIKSLSVIENATDKNWSTPHNIKVTMEGHEAAAQDQEVYEDITAEIKLTALPETGKIMGYVKEGAFPVEDANVTLEIDGELFWTSIDDAGRYELTDVPAGENYTVTAQGMINNISAYETAVNDSVSVEAGNTTMVNFNLVKKPLPVSVQVQSFGEDINADGAEDVDIDTRIIIIFDYPMVNITISNNTHLYLGDVEIPGIIQEVEPSTMKKYEFSISGELEKDKIYTLLISEGVRRLVGGAPVPVFWEDYIISFDTELEPIIEFGPADGSTNIGTVTPNIYVVFQNKIELNKTSLDNSFVLMSGNQKIAGAVIVDHQIKRVSFNPTEELESETEYTVHLVDDLRDASGRFILRDRVSRTWTFTTAKTTTEVTGRVMDKDNKPLANAMVKLTTVDGTPVATTTTNSTGHFEFKGLEPKNYNLTISKKDYDTITQQVSPQVGAPSSLQNLRMEKEEDEEGGFTIDPLLLGIIILAIIIVIIIIAGVAMRKPRVEEELEAEVEERMVPSAPTPAARRFEPEPTMRGAPPLRGAPPRELEPEMARKPQRQRSMNRCPICAHRLNTAGECFHCKMDMMYGR